MKQKESSTDEVVGFSWSLIEQLVSQIVLQINNSGQKYSAVYGLPRGGLIPAVMFSHQLGLPYYDWADLGSRTEPARHHNVLIVDDVIETGKTIKSRFAWSSDLRPFDIATLIDKLQADWIDYYGLRVDLDVWVKFPWESDQSTTLNNDGDPTYPSPPNRSFLNDESGRV